MTLSRTDLVKWYKQKPEFDLFKREKAMRNRKLLGILARMFLHAIGKDPMRMRN